MKRNLFLLSLLLAGSTSIQAVHYTSPNPEVQKKLDACLIQNTSGITGWYYDQCVDEVKKEHPNEVQKSNDETTSTIHAGE